MNMGISYVFRADGYGGVEKCDLNCGQDVIFIRGELADEWESIDEFLLSNRTYATLQECIEKEGL
jgi:hypothetical protein